MATAIGHPHQETLDYLQRQLPRLESRGYRLAFISEVLAPQLARSHGSMEHPGSD